MSRIDHQHRDVLSTVRSQLKMARHVSKPGLSPSEVSICRRWLVLHSAQKPPPVLLDFADLGSHPFNLYKVISF